MFLGIDVSKNTLDVALLGESAKPRHKIFANNAAGHLELLMWLGEQQSAGAVHACLEAIGTWADAVSMALHEAGHKVSLVNPAQIHAFGRGTSTYDGLSIAWAVAEYLHELGPKTLFATHYHHLNELEEQLPRVKNYRIAVKEDGEHINFLRRIIRGGTDRSFGIQVARLAGLPTPVIARAKELLNTFSQERLRGDLSTPAATSKPPKPQTVNLFDHAESTPAPPHPVLEELKALDVDNLTPLEAIIKLLELRKRTL